MWWLRQWKRTSDWFRRAYRARDPLLAYLAVDPDYRELRGGPRFEELVEEIGILR